jgi:hypothetical protein
MYKKMCLLSLFLCLAFTGAAQPFSSPQHFFQLNLYLAYGTIDWLEVTLELNGKPKVMMFESLPGTSSPYRFPLNEINMDQKGLLQVTQLRYQDHNTGEISTLPFRDSPECRIEISPKNGYPHSTVSSLYLDPWQCGNLSVRPLQ